MSKAAKASTSFEKIQLSQEQRLEQEKKLIARISHLEKSLTSEPPDLDLQKTLFQSVFDPRLAPEKAAIKVFSLFATLGSRHQKHTIDPSFFDTMCQHLKEHNAFPEFNLNKTSSSYLNAETVPWEVWLSSHQIDSFLKSLHSYAPDKASAFGFYAIIKDQPLSRIEKNIASIIDFKASTKDKNSLHLKALEHAFLSRNLATTEFLIRHDISLPPFESPSWNQPPREIDCLFKNQHLKIGDLTISAFLEKVLPSLFKHPSWSSRSDQDQTKWAQSIFDELFMGSSKANENYVSPELRALLKPYKAMGPSAMAYRRKIEKSLSTFISGAPSYFEGRQAAQQREDEINHCAELIKKAKEMLPLLRQEDQPKGCEPLAILLLGHLTLASTPGKIEQAITDSLNYWSKNSFGSHALQWSESKGGLTYSLGQAICSLPKTKSNDWSESAGTWLGALMSQGFDPYHKLSPKSKSVAERALSTQSVGAIYAMAEAIALKSSLSKKPTSKEGMDPSLPSVKKNRL